MRRVLVGFCVFLAVAACPAPAAAWGFAAHRYIMGKAIDLLPAAMKPFFEHFRSEVVMRSTDPDTWRNVGWEDDPNHFVDFGDPLLGPYPFTALPRDSSAAVEKFGAAAMKRLGTLPWREAEEFGNLRRAFEGFAKNSPYATSDVVLFAGVAAHYIQDAHQPFHATNNYDGQLTGQHGIHNRFERDLMERFATRLIVDARASSSITNPRDAAFEALLVSYSLVPTVLEADKTAIAGKAEYDGDYFEKFFTAVRPVLEKQLAAAAAATAGVLVGAWEQAGKPALGTVDARPVQKVR
jgi:hypothetical protein